MYVIHYIGGAVTVMKTSKKQAEQAVADLERRTVENAGRFPERILLADHAKAREVMQNLLLDRCVFQHASTVRRATMAQLADAVNAYCC